MKRERLGAAGKVQKRPGCKCLVMTGNHYRHLWFFKPECVTSCTRSQAELSAHYEEIIFKPRDHHRVLQGTGHEVAEPWGGGPRLRTTHADLLGLRLLLLLALAKLNPHWFPLGQQQPCCWHGLKSAFISAIVCHREPKVLSE